MLSKSQALRQSTFFKRGASRNAFWELPVVHDVAGAATKNIATARSQARTGFN